MQGVEVYNEIIKKWGARPSQRLINILEAMFTPDEGKALLELFSPATCQEVAAKLKVDEKSLYRMLEDLVARGILTKGKTQYAFHTSLLAFHHDVVGDPAVEPVPDKIRTLWGDFFYNEWYQDFVDGYIKRQEKTGRPVHRVWPAIGALDLSPNIKPEQILPEENFRLFIQNSKNRIIAPCGCRKLWAKCDHAIETCFACFDNSRGDYYLGKPGRVLREVSMEESLEIARKAEEAGLVHIGVCYCCPDACEILYSLTKTKRFDLLGASRYQAAVNPDLCTGCQECLDRCYFEAIEMKKTAGSKKLKASIVDENCKGCGLCVTGCKQKALTLELVRPPEFIQVPRQEAGPDMRKFSPWGFYDLK
jgi:Na+-translocating ferredoxin:NAD+ oxidoreductase RNF subunit RnfB